MTRPVRHGEAMRLGPWHRRAVYVATGALVLSVTGYLLYYAGGEDARPVLSALQ